MRSSIDRSLIRGIGWTALSRWSTQLLSWAVLLYAARVLTPGDFGLVAMAMVPIGLARLIEDLGLDSAIVQNKALSKQQISALGGLAILFGLFLTVSYFTVAPAIADFYGEDQLVPIVRILSLLFLIDALQIVPRALLQKELQFGILALVNGLQLGTSAAFLGVGAFLGLSFWALVLNHVLSHLVATGLLNWIRPHPLAMPRSWKEIAPSVRFGGHMLVSRIAWYGYSNLDQAILGRYSGKESLGAYSFAMTFARIPTDEIGSLSGKVVPGVFSAVQKSPRKLRRYVLLLTEATSYLTIPATVGIALVANDFVPIAIGSQWGAVIWPLQILCIYTTVHSLTSLWSHVLIWTGHAKANMYLNLFALVILPTSFMLSVHRDSAGIAAAWAIAYPIALLPAFLLLSKIIHLRFRSLAHCLTPALTSSAGMTLCVLFTRDFLLLDAAPWLRLAACVGVGVLSYGGIMLGYRRRITRIIRTIRRSI